MSDCASSIVLYKYPLNLKYVFSFGLTPVTAQTSFSVAYGVEPNTFKGYGV